MASNCTFFFLANLILFSPSLHFKFLFGPYSAFMFLPSLAHSIAMLLILVHCVWSTAWQYFGMLINQFSVLDPFSVYIYKLLYANFNGITLNWSSFLLFNNSEHCTLDRTCPKLYPYFNLLREQFCAMHFSYEYDIFPFLCSFVHHSFPISLSEFRGAYWDWWPKTRLFIFNKWICHCGYG